MRQKSKLWSLLNGFPACNVMFCPWRHLLTSAVQLSLGWGSGSWLRLGIFFVNLGDLQLTNLSVRSVSRRYSSTTGSCLLFGRCRVRKRRNSAHFSARKCCTLICAAICLNSGSNYKRPSADGNGANMAEPNKGYCAVQPNISWSWYASSKFLVKMLVSCEELHQLTRGLCFKLIAP